MTNVLAGWLSNNDITQAHIAETEKYAHVTFDGGVENRFTGEERHMIPSPKVAIYVLQPKMSAQDVADKVTEICPSKKNTTMCNFAPPPPFSFPAWAPHVWPSLNILFAVCSGTFAIALPKVSVPVQLCETIRSWKSGEVSDRTRCRYPDPWIRLLRM